MNSFYDDTLYPLQDKVLKVIASLKTPFYLTGGTALSRGYYQHRYSDDLDLFVNSDPEFTQHAEKCITLLQQSFNLTVTHRSSSYYSIKIDDLLKVEFVSDIPYHADDFTTQSFFPKVDNVTNILSNKLSALISRDEPKDVVDICIIAQNNKINWPTIFQDTNSKAVGIFPPDVAKRLLEFPLELLNLIKWTPDHVPHPAQFQHDLQIICDSIIK